MPSAKQVMAILSGHFADDAERIYTVALQIAASEARQGHSKSAEALRKLIDDVRAMVSGSSRSSRINRERE